MHIWLCHFTLTKTCKDENPFYITKGGALAVQLAVNIPLLNESER